MKDTVKIIAVAAALAWIWWSQPPTSFNARWVAMPSAMTREMFITARKAAERPAAMTYTYCKWPNCRRS